MRTSLDSITPPKRPALVAADRTKIESQPSVLEEQSKKIQKKKTRSGVPRPIEINISLPEKITLPKLPHIPVKKLQAILKKVPRGVYWFLAFAAVLAIVWLVILSVMDQQRKNDYTTITANGTKVTELNKGQPTYNTILPEGKSITELGGWTRVSPADRNPVFAYVDHIGTVQINVSQQPLPDSFKEDLSNQILYLAQGYHADVKIDASGTTVYVGTSAKGPQSVIFTKNNLLVLIKTTTKVENDDWAAYVSSLK